MTAPLNTSSDDALFFQASMGDADAGSNEDDTEDPVGRGASRVGQLDMFVSRPPKARHHIRGGNGEPLTQVNLTKGANLIAH